jgi:5-methylcytosine-specific restriction endonuclease McrA
MTAHRRPTIRFSDAPRGECRWCGDPILYASGPKQGELDRRRRWHPACVDAYNRSDPREARRRVRRRDKGICAACGLDTNALRRRARGRGRAAKLRKLGFKPRKSLWELDHVVPLIDGGTHDLENLQTLCTPCHKRKTAEEARERATRRQTEHEASLLERADEALAASEALLARVGSLSASD